MGTAQWMWNAWVKIDPFWLAEVMLVSRFAREKATFRKQAGTGHGPVINLGNGKSIIYTGLSIAGVYISM